MSADEYTHSMGSRRLPPWRAYSYAALGLVLWSGGLSGPARAGTIEVTCDTLAAALAGASDGDAFRLIEMCVGTTAEIAQGSQITLVGGPGAGLVASGNSEPLISGTDVGNTVIKNLSFRDANIEDSGGALSFEDSTPRIVNNTFLNNQSSLYGGAVYIDVGETTTPAPRRVIVKNNTFGAPSQGNVAQVGGGLYLHGDYHEVELAVEENTFVDNKAQGAGGAFISTAPNEQGSAPQSSGTEASRVLRMAGNSFRSNNAEVKGAGAMVVAHGATSIQKNVFRLNEVESTDIVSGGGLHLSINHDIFDGAVRQSSNTFAENVIAGYTALGAGEFIEGHGNRIGITEPFLPAKVLSVNDRFIGNTALAEELTPTVATGACRSSRGSEKLASSPKLDTLPTCTRSSQGPPGKTQGGGLAIRGILNFTGTQLVATGNEANNGLGGGIYSLGSETPNNFVDLKLLNATVTANKTGAEGMGTQLFGGEFSKLTAFNSILFGTGSSITGFEERSIKRSDACKNNGDPSAGPGNICMKPKLVDAAAGDVHQKASSPTRDKGRNSLKPKVKRDIDGQKRILDSDGNGSKVIDMGADERKLPRGSGAA